MNVLAKKKVADLLKKGVLVSPDFIERADTSIDPNKDLVVLDNETNKLLSNAKNVNWKEIEKIRVMYEKGKAALPTIDDIAPVVENELKDVQVISSYKTLPEKADVSNFTGYFNTRYKLIERLLRSRPELQNLSSISRMKNREFSNSVSIIGIINEKMETKNKNLMITLEDSTGKQRVLVNKNKPDLYPEAKDLVVDEVIGINGVYKKDILFVNKIVFPDIPAVDIKKSPDEEYLACMSDLHFGSKQFMPDEFNRFLSWVNLETGNQKQKKIAEKLKYILIAGDIVDGIGVYNNQDSELTTLDIKKQYGTCTKLLSEIPKHINIVISPGNHDAVRMAEPQPPLNNQFSQELTKLKNVLLVSNPATIRIGAKEGFSGFNCLLYHGYSFDYYVANVDSIRMNGGYERADLIMNFLLKRRHLAPAHTSTLINPTLDYDALFIDPVPDFFIAGHIHRTSVSNYKATTLVNSSCWQSMTSFQERLGHNPQPARLPLINLKTRDASIINFGK
ncbi:DNA polymerase II [Candidatus Woesearchaeota archaeon]|nr:DNA polymerase II [Candidatus Woesearchaeota archaeon]|tara:strand:- start:17320 stop:18837 length:1518 start_codon:yes stop_codon:yes gene_type:complete